MVEENDAVGVNLASKIQRQYNCTTLFNCCDCGYCECGCNGCFSCNACDECMNDREESCEHKNWNV